MILKFTQTSGTICKKEFSHLIIVVFPIKNYIVHFCLYPILIWVPDFYVNL